MFIDRIRIVCYIGTTYLGKYYTRAFYMYQMFCVPKNSVEGCQHFCCVRCFKPATCLLIILYIEQQRERLRNISSHWGHVDLPFPFFDYIGYCSVHFFKLFCAGVSFHQVLGACMLDCEH